MNPQKFSLFQIHIAVVLFGLSGLFGKLIGLPAMAIVFGRVVFSCFFLIIVIIFLKKSIVLRKRIHYIYLLIMGIILAAHWTTFFKSIQMSTVAIGLLTFSTFPVFVTFLEPLFFKEKLEFSDVLISIVAFLGVVVVVPVSKSSGNMVEGAIWGIISGLTYAILSMLNRKYVKEYSSFVIALYEQMISAAVLAPFVAFQKTVFNLRDILLLILLGVVFTGVSHTLFINGLKHIKAQTASIISSLEPVYGIIFAAIILTQVPNMREILGGLIILGTGFYSSIKS